MEVESPNSTSTVKYYSSGFSEQHSHSLTHRTPALRVPGGDSTYSTALPADVGDKLACQLSWNSPEIPHFLALAPNLLYSSRCPPPPQTHTQTSSPWRALHRHGGRSFIGNLVCFALRGCFLGGCCSFGCTQTAIQTFDKES